ncbi:PEP-CTERM sorting domain-containing protein [Pseudorhodoferax sp. Leaf265]|uniref:PEP-CTERM sorting domain-containing protein n=1 Tax=Pseudorhodoferax sp. Leaf265 TaxID=1736315 RepID=UPI0006FB5380|nr:PEP-CTERM sorting domain-containing protein [Pseudorhodoferax sp. Leaf265]KQP02485.1 hypothetical protein ASF45_20745 [Pseudorhodoferax sp. Leaf265]
MKKIAAALALAGACIGAQAGYVPNYIAWTINGLTDHPETGDKIPFSAWIGIDTQRLAPDRWEEGYGYSTTAATFRWRVPAVGGCSGRGIATLHTTARSVHIAGIEPATDCALSLSISAAVDIASAGPFESQLAAWDRAFTTYTFTPGIQFYVIGSSGNPAFSSMELTSVRQSVPEPSPAALIGAGLAGLLWARRRKGARTQ